MKCNMNSINGDLSIQSQDFADLAELCREAGAVGSATINCCGNVVVFYKDPNTRQIQEADYLDELHIDPQKKVRVFIAVFPINGI